MTRRRRRTASDPLGLVGWVFADLLLGLAVVFLATQPGDPNAGAGPSDTTTTTAPPTTTTTEAPEVEVEPGVDTQYRCIRVQADPALLSQPPGPARDQYGDQLALVLLLKLREQNLERRDAGIVLLFGTADNSGVGKIYSEQFRDLVLPRIPELSGSATRPFWGGGPTVNAAPGSIELNIYPLIGPGRPPLGPANEC